MDGKAWDKLDRLDKVKIRSSYDIATYLFGVMYGLIGILFSIKLGFSAFLVILLSGIIGIILVKMYEEVK